MACSSDRRHPRLLVRGFRSPERDPAHMSSNCALAWHTLKVCTLWTPFAGASSACCSSTNRLNLSSLPASSDGVRARLIRMLREDDQVSLRLSMGRLLHRIGAFARVLSRD